MLDRILTQDELLRLIDELGRKRRIIGPVRNADRFLYQPVEKAASLDLGFDYCVFSPKAALFPPRETLFTYNRENGAFVAAPVYDAAPIVLAGVHPCDVHAIRLLDHVFGADFPDVHYQTRRRSTFIIAVDCPRPCHDTAFCVDMDANHAESGFDLMLYPLGTSVASESPPLSSPMTKEEGVDDTAASCRGSVAERRYGVVFGTPAGRESVLYQRLGTPPAVIDERAIAQYTTQKRSAFPLKLTVESDRLSELLAHSYDSLLWEATARRCYSCGSCNLVCPTCYCFDMHDEGGLAADSGRRVREWDGCQLRGFAEVAGGHNFRPTAAARLRHRVFRKGKWIRERTGLPGCVGCARCDRACTAKISLVEIFNQLAEEQ